MDVVLSSGFLAFAEHTGFLQALEDSELAVDAVVGTSSGAMTGALWCAGWSPDDLIDELCATVPLGRIGLHLPLWRGLFTMRPVIDRLREVLPARFSDLRRPFGVGVADARTGEHYLVTQGDLPAAVAASCAVPRLFKPVVVNGRLCMDGGAVDRLGLPAWRRWRGQQPAIAHLIQRSMGPPISDDLSQLTVVSSPRSGARLWSLGDIQHRRQRSTELAQTALHRHNETSV